MSLIKCHFITFTHTCGHRSYQSTHYCKANKCPDMDYSHKHSSDLCSYCQLWDRVDRGEAKSPASAPPPIVCSQTTVKYTCGSSSFRTVHQCGREECKRIAYKFEDSEQVCCICQAAGYPPYWMQD
ncbi:MAG: hypothetical protein FRX48_04524 [Lasallia pustulata]|uniref:Uncharacterized protein n=1 Tax=Lasallia pustulata TaxID=136370 RepID=A0A5M8PP15_9LECA|nr:MAG: hypothetical protein FRX48_04524 [Lasallia pustulata]